jgi:hypothetical protein
VLMLSAKNGRSATDEREQESDRDRDRQWQPDGGGLFVVSKEAKGEKGAPVEHGTSLGF